MALIDIYRLPIFLNIYFFRELSPGGVLGVGYSTLAKPTSGHTPLSHQFKYASLQRYVDRKREKNNR